MINMKVIIWGHKKNGHTHGYIHKSYFKAFSKMGYETYWFDDNDNVSGFNFDNCIFLTEDQVQKKIPLNKTSKYILHHTDLNKYIQNNISFINLANYLKSCDNGVSAYHVENSVEKINDCCFWDNKTKTIYQPWATNLTPDEINIDDIPKYNDNESDVYYIGTSHDNSNKIVEFSNSIKKYNKNFIVKNGVSDEENMELIKKSLISADIRSDWHIECGYLPCRIFKNISYGRLTGTNSENVKKIFGDYVIYDDKIENLFDKIIQEEKINDLSKIRSAMNFIKNNHTYFNRIKNLLQLL